MARFFVDREAVDTNNNMIVITGEDVNHIKNVLRSVSGDALMISDGCGTDYDAVIERLEKEKIIARIAASVPNMAEPPINITLYQGIPKSDKMDSIIQKSVELGVKRIVPVITERTVVRFNDDGDAAVKTVRWRRISLEAAKQCNRGIVPAVGTPVYFEDAVKLPGKEGLRLIPYEKEKTIRLKEYLREFNPKQGGCAEISVFIGPEGGFAEDEIGIAVGCGIRPVTLGPRILRTETAGPAALTILMYELGDMG